MLFISFMFSLLALACFQPTDLSQAFGASSCDKSVLASRDHLIYAFIVAFYVAWSTALGTLWSECKIIITPLAFRYNDKLYISDLDLIVMLLIAGVTFVLLFSIPFFQNEFYAVLHALATDGNGALRALPDNYPYLIMPFCWDLALL